MTQDELWERTKRRHDRLEATVAGRIKARTLASWQATEAGWAFPRAVTALSSYRRRHLDRGRAADLDSASYYLDRVSFVLSDVDQGFTEWMQNQSCADCGLSYSAHRIDGDSGKCPRFELDADTEEETHARAD